jgi:hypothetical protein
MHDPVLEKIIPALGNTVYMAVEDLYDATIYIENNFKFTGD